MEPLKSPHWEALTPATREAFRQVSYLPFIKSFYLAGGTGLALHLGHRFSVDLDLFSTDSESVNLDQRTLIHKLLEHPSLEIIYDKDGTFSSVWQGVGISFFRLPQYPIIQEPVLIDGIPLASIPEIGAMKLAAIIDRGTRKDMVDLYFILQHFSLETLFEVSAVKYKRVKSFAVNALRAMAYFADAEALPMPRMMDKTSWTKMKKYLTEQAISAGRKNLIDLWDFE